MEHYKRGKLLSEIKYCYEKILMKYYWFGNGAMKDFRTVENSATSLWYEKKKITHEINKVPDLKYTADL